MPKYLIILAGLPRGGEVTWNSIYKYVVKPLNADLAICTENIIDKNSSLYKQAKYKWLFEGYNNWFDYYEKNFNGYWKKIFKIGEDTGLSNSGSVHFAIKDIIKKNYIETIEKYDFFIYSRFDQYFIMDHPKYDNGKIWIPEGEDYTGVCDRHALLSTKYAYRYLNICEFVDNKILDYKIPRYLNCEAVYKMHLQHENLYDLVNRNIRFQFTTAKKNDFTRWRIPKYKLYLFKDLYLKYPSEFLEASDTLINEKGLFYFIIFKFILFINFSYLKIKIIAGKKLKMKKNEQK